MKNKIFPCNLTQSILLFLAALVFSTPILGLGLSKSFSIEVETNVLLIVLLLFIIGITKYINHRNGVLFTFNFKPDFSFLGLKLVFLCSFQIAFILPLNYLIKKLYPFLNNDTSLINNNILSLLSIIILGPFVEEVIFRGIILKGYLSTYRPLKAVIISAILFSVIHVHPLQIIGACFFGFFVGVFFLEKNNLSNMIILHSSVNLITVVVKTHFLNIYYMPGSLSLPIFIFSFIICGYCFWRLFKLNTFAVLSFK